MHKRTDRLTAFHIDQAVNLASSYVVAAGANALFELDIPLDLARRVLLQPERRRDAVPKQTHAEPLRASTPD